jgi:hypothetical protein
MNFCCTNLHTILTWINVIKRKNVRKYSSRIIWGTQRWCTWQLSCSPTATNAVIFHSYLYFSLSQDCTDMNPRPMLCHPLSVLFWEPGRSAQKLELASVNHCFTQVCTTWKGSSILDFLHFARSKKFSYFGAKILLVLTSEVMRANEW